MKSFNCSISVSYVLISVCLSCASIHDDMCSNHVNGYYGKEAIIDCFFQSDYGVYWYEDTDEEPLIRLESGVKSGRGYDSNEYDVLQNGSLVINNVQLKHEQEYTVISLASDFRVKTFLVTFSVVENYCPSQVSGLHGEEGMISCYFRPNFQTIIWFDETSTRDPLIVLENNTKSGRGYDSGKYDVLQNGSLVIKTIEFINEQKYITVAVIFGSTNITQFSIAFFVIEHCPTQQSGFFGEKGIIICHFKPNFTKVSWYLEQDKPLIQLEGSDIFGPGYENEKYSVKQNGSLVIRLVTEDNKAIYTVILIDAKNISTVHRVEFKLETGCWGRQYGYCGKEGIINCNFEPGYEDVYWYDDTIEYTSIIRLENGVKSGKGYDSNEYDVSQNGSLVIKNVQLNHEQEYKVIRYGGEHQIMEYRITFSVIGAEVTSCWPNGTAATNPVAETDNSHSVTTEPQFTTAYTTETTKPENYCASPQHGYLGQVGIISCNIDPGINEVYWFNETDEYHHPFIRMEYGYISGSGYKSNEYDILQNASLVIRNVQYNHQQSYQVTFQIGSQVDLRVEFSVIEDSNRGYLHWKWTVVVAAVVVVLVVIKIRASTSKKQRQQIPTEDNGL